MNLLPFVLAFALIASPALAHEPRKGPNGGDLVDAGTAYHVEIVGQGATLTVHVSDATDKPLPAAEFKALAIMVIDGKTHRIELAPSADGKTLTGPTPAPMTRVKGAIQLTDRTGKTSTARVN